MCRESIPDKKSCQCKISAARRLGPIQEIKRGTVRLESVTDKVGEVDRNQITHGHIGHANKFGFYSKCHKSRPLKSF